jgi:polyphosphate kinase 2 (PPK2 family)
MHSAILADHGCAASRKVGRGAPGQKAKQKETHRDCTEGRESALAEGAREESEATENHIRANQMSKIVVVLTDEESGKEIVFNDVTQESDPHSLRIYKITGGTSPVAYLDLKYVKRWYIDEEETGQATAEELQEAYEAGSGQQKRK